MLEHCLSDLRALLARLRGEPLDLAVAKALAQQLLQALAACHAAGWVHRDVAPSNVLVSPQGTARLADFGQARRLPGAGRAAGAGAAANGVPAGHQQRAGQEGADPGSECGAGDDDDDDATPPGGLTPGACLCTRWYKAPELLLNGRSYGQGVDMWGAGCILAELLAGRALFPGSSDIAQLALMADLLGSLSEERWPGEGGAGLPHRMADLGTRTRASRRGLWQRTSGLPPGCQPAGLPGHACKRLFHCIAPVLWAPCRHSGAA